MAKRKDTDISNTGDRPRPVHYSFTLASLGNLCGMSLSAITKHHQRGSFDSTSLRSVICFVVRYGTPDLRQEILIAATTQTASVAAKEREKRKKAKH